MNKLVSRGLRLDEVTNKELEYLATQLGESKSGVIRHAIKTLSYLQKESKKGSTFSINRKNGAVREIAFV